MASTAQKEKRGKETRALQKQFDVAESGRLFVAVPSAEIHLHATDLDRAKIEVSVNTGSKQEALNYIDRIKLRVRAVDKQTIRIESKSIYQSQFQGWNAVDTFRARIDISLPRRFNVDIQTAGSDVSLNGLEGRLALQVSGGAVQGEKLKGKLEVFGYGSAIQIDQFEGTKLDLMAAGGSLQADNLKAEHITIRTASTDTQLANIEGPASLAFHNGYTDINNLFGPVTASVQGGNAALALSELDEVTLQILGGELDLKLDTSMEAWLLFEGPDLEMSDSFAFEGDKTEDRIEGSLNGGKQVLRAQVASGTLRCTPS